MQHNYFKESYPQYLHLNKDTRLYYVTNFSPEEKITTKDKVLVFNYGLVCNFNHFKYQLPFFDKKGYKILIHDYRFHFQSVSNENISTLTFDNMVDDLKAILKKSKIKKAVHIGHSMGVNISLEYARKYPKEVQGMTLISGTVVPPQDIMFDSNVVEVFIPYIIKLQKEYPDIFNAIWKNSYFNPLVQKAIHIGGFNTSEVSIAFVKYYLERISKLDPEVFFRLFEEMKLQKIMKDLPNIKAPAFIVTGDKDQIVPSKYQNILVDYLPNNRLSIIKSGSHVPQVDFPEFINREIEQFLNEVLIK